MEGSSGKPVMETEEGKLFKMVATNDTCPDCGHKGFLGGPSGGMSQNVYCGNVHCRSGFNVTAFSATQGLCERIGKIELDRYPDWAFKIEGEDAAERVKAIRETIRKTEGAASTVAA